MKCGTSALHRHLDTHPEISMAPAKELNFFFGPSLPPPVPPQHWWRTGQWHRGPGWWRAQLGEATAVVGEASPGYTDPAHPEVPARMRAIAPRARVVYLVRDPWERAWSQWRHHVADGSEQRPPGQALLDERSQYVARSRYLERFAGFRDVFPREQLLVVVQERLRRDPRTALPAVFAHLGVDPAHWDPSYEDVVHAGPTPATAAAGADPGLRRAFEERVADDVEALRDYLDDDLSEWSTSSQRERNASRP
jgi:hypothetical protein